MLINTPSPEQTSVDFEVGLFCAAITLTSHSSCQIVCVRRWCATFDLVFIILRSVQVHGRRVPVERVDGVGVGEQLREERLEDVGEV